MRKLQLLFVTFLVAVLSCTKKEEVTTPSNDPAISFIGLSAGEVENFNNSVALIISYQDDNGDLGYENPDTYALWVKDSRLDSADWYHIPPLAPQGYNLKIEGSLNIVLNRMFILGNGDQELVSFAVKIRDRSNHWSNTIYTSTIKIKKP